MPSPEIPNFGELLAPYLSQVPAEALPYMLSQLERTAADRYRYWADLVPEHESGLIACADREDEIAERVEALFPPSDEHRRLVAELIPAAREAYYNIFAPHTPIEQMKIQEDAERQGANAWQGLKEAYPQHTASLNELSEIELRSAQYLTTILP